MTGHGKMTSKRKTSFSTYFFRREILQRDGAPSVHVLVLVLRRPVDDLGEGGGERERGSK